MKLPVRFLPLLLALGIPLAPLAAQEKAGPAPLRSTFYDWNGLMAKPTPDGVYRKVADGPTAGLQRLEFHVTTLLPGHISHPPHHHPQEELVLLHDGTLEATVNGKSQQIGAGSLLFFAAHDMHNVRNVGTTPATYYVINFYTAATMAVRNQPAHEWAPPGLQPSSVIDWNRLEPKVGAAETRRQLIDSPTLTFKHLEIHATTVPAGAAESKPHQHPWPMLVVMQEGCMEAKVDGVAGLVGPGSVLFIAANAVQSMRNHWELPATYFVFSVVSDGVPTS